MGKTLITGATGGLGSSVVEFLTEMDNAKNIAVLVRNPNSEKAVNFVKKGIEVHVGDYNDKVSLIKAFQGTDNLYFVSGNDMGARIKQHQNVIEACIETKVGHVFYTSAGLNNLSVDAPIYSAMSAHIETEKMIKESGVTYTILRHNLYSEVISMFLGNRGQLLESKSVFLPTGSGKTAFIPRTELAEAGAIMLTAPAGHANKTYELSGSEKVTFEQIAGYLSDTLGETITYVSPDVKEFESTLTSLGVPADIIGMISVFSLGIADGVFDTPKSDIEAILGRKTQSVASFIENIYKQ